MSAPLYASWTEERFVYEGFDVGGLPRRRLVSSEDRRARLVGYVVRNQRTWAVLTADGRLLEKPLAELHHVSELPALGGAASTGLRRPARPAHPVADEPG